MRPGVLLISCLVATSLAAQTTRPASKPSSRPSTQAALRPAVRATGSKEALGLAQRVFDHAGGKEGLARVQNLVFTFKAGQSTKRLFWDLRARKVRVEYPEPPPGFVLGVRISVLVFDIAKDENVLRHPPRPNPRAPRMSAKSDWINDSYWLLVTLKVLDPGVVLAVDPPREGDLAGIRRLRLRFEKVGLTPKNEYVLHVESDTGRVVRWDYYRRGGANPRRVRSWAFEDYQRVGPLRLSLSRRQLGTPRRKLDIELQDVKVNVPAPKDVWTSTEKLFLKSE